MHTRKYQGYKAIDFLKDDDFLRWNLYRLEEDRAYWEQVMAENPDLSPEVERAIELYKTQVRLNDYSLTSHQVELYHDAFQSRVSGRGKRRTINYWLSGAAAILLLLALNQIYKPFVKKDSGLLDFVQANSVTVDPVSKDIQLYVSSEHLITIEEKEADITYNTDSIQVTGKSMVEVNTLEYSQLVVPKGRRSRLILSDGTTLHVNAGTKVIYPNRFTEDVREIYVDGEVFLDVTPNEKQPFIVRTNELSIRVLGTRFNVMAYVEDAEARVVLASGTVQVTSTGNPKKTDLAPSEMYDYKAGKAMVTRVDVDKHISWVHGMLHVDDERLDILMTRLSRYYGEEIICDESVVNQRCSGKIDLKSDLGEVLNGLTFSFPIETEYENGIYRVRTK